MQKSYCLTLAVVTLIFVLSWQPLYASGAFSPFFGDIGNAEFNKGKAIYSGRIGTQGCIACHSTFDRSHLMSLKSPVSEYISNCRNHKPCYDKMTEKDKNAIETYIKRRYHL